MIHFWRSIVTGKPQSTTNSSEPLNHDDITVVENLSVPEEAVSATSSWSHPSTTDEARMETDQMSCKESFLSSSSSGVTRKSLEELATITTSEIHFADAVNACTPHGDIESQRRCVEGYKRWLKSQ